MSSAEHYLESTARFLRRRPHVREQDYASISDSIEDHELWGKQSRGNTIEAVLGMRGTMVGEAAAWQQGINRYGAERLEERDKLLTRIRCSDLLEDSPAVRRQIINNRHAAGACLILTLAGIDDII